MNANEQTLQAKRATKAIFLVCGLAISSWAPMVPFAKERLGLNDASLGLLLLLLGAGAILMMPISGFLSHRFGTRKVIMGSGMITAAVLPLLLIMPDPVTMGVTIFVFGAAVGTVDVAMNSQAIHVQNRQEKSIMSSIHGLFSVGGLLGALGLGLLIKAGLSPLVSAVAIAILLVLILIWKYPALLSKELEHHTPEHPKEEQQSSTGKKLSWLNSSVIFLGAACFAVFLSEGAMLDWSALFLKENRNVEAELAGIGYAAFSVAMATMRLLGDGIVEKFQPKTVVLGGGVLAATGLFLAVSAPWVGVTLFGFILLGIGAANIVPVFFSEGGKLRNVPASIAIPAISTMGYAGQLAGPALLGFIAYRFSLSAALIFIGILLLTVAVAYWIRKPQNNT